MFVVCVNLDTNWDFNCTLKVNDGGKMGLGRGGSKCPKVTGTGKVTGTISNKTMSLLATSPARPQTKQMKI